MYYKKFVKLIVDIEFSVYTEYQSPLKFLMKYD